MRVCAACIRDTDEQTCIGILIAARPCERCKKTPPTIVVKESYNEEAKEVEAERRDRD